MIKKILFLCMMLMILLMPKGPVEAAGITAYEKFISPAYWTEHNADGDKVVLNAAGVEAFNKKIIAASPTVYDMAAYPKTLSGKTVATYVNTHTDLSDELYREGKLVSDNYKNILRSQTNAAAIPAEVTVRYGVTVRRANLRNLPTGEGLFFYAGDRNFDALQETALDPGEAVAILHTSTNGYFYYVQAYNYRGWLSKFDVAETDRSIWLRYAEPKNFLTVVAKDYTLKADGAQVLFQQGARLQLADKKASAYTVKVPVRTKEGKLQEEKVVLAANASLHECYLPYTTNNIIRSAFKFYDSVYGWGGLQQSVDCSSFISNAYRTVGIFLPRNADEQETSAGIHKKMGNMSSAQRANVIKGLTPGSTLHMDGHVMLYLGSSNEIPYAIHSLGSHYTGGTRHSVMKVVVSDLNLQKSNGNTYLDELTTCVTFR